jgi:hypothetical protein
LIIRVKINEEPKYTKAKEGRDINDRILGDNDINCTKWRVLYDERRIEDGETFGAF